MVAGIALLLLLAPEDPAQMLRVAWASQYEWKEDKVQSATIDFTYEWTWGEKGEFSRTGKGQLVIVGDAIVRRHYPDAADEDMRTRIDRHVDWVLASFVRKPFEEAFKDAKFAGPEKSAYDWMKITANDKVRYVKDDRLVGEERNIGPPDKPFVVRVDYKLADVGGGYAIVGESIAYTRQSDSMKVTQERALTTRMEGDRPAPSSYAFEEKSAREKSRFTIEFPNVRFDLPDPVTLDPAARDLLKGAWGKRLVLPEDIRILGQFQRVIDKDLDRARWRGDVHGDFQVYGMDNIQIKLDEDNEETHKQCERDIRGIFALLRDTPFDTEFLGCGFEREPQGDETVIRVYGYPKALAFRIADGVIVGHYDRALSELEWWTYKTKSAGEGRFQIEKMRREIEGRKIDLEFDYQRVRGHQIPKKFGVLGSGPSFRGTDTALGIAEYIFKKPKVSFPDE
ncbi:MAG: hypothetical protein ACHQ1G_07685 [Planctomycetota bacterium]